VLLASPEGLVLPDGCTLSLVDSAHFGQPSEIKHRRLCLTNILRLGRDIVCAALPVRRPLIK